LIGPPEFVAFTPGITTYPQRRTVALRQTAFFRLSVEIGSRFQFDGGHFGRISANRQRRLSHMQVNFMLRSYSPLQLDFVIVFASKVDI
jgi:hypothetical protein